MDAMRVKAQSIGGDSTLKPTRRLPRRVGSAELAYGGADLLGLLEVADVPAAGDHDEFGVGDRLLELARDAERGTRVELTADQQGRYEDVGQQVALVGRGQHEQLPNGRRALRVARDSATELEHGAPDPVVAQSIACELVNVAHARRIIHHGDRVEVIGECRSR